MRSLLPRPARLTRRGPGLLAVTLLALSASACALITGVPDVDEVRVDVAPDHILTGATTQATGAAYNKGKVVNSSKVVVGYSSSDPAVATVNPVNGQVRGVGPGFAIITAATRRHSGTDTVWVTDAPPANITLSQVNLTVGAVVPLTIELRDIAGQVLAPRKADITSSNPTIVTVIPSAGGTSAGATLRGVSVGNAVITVNVGGTIQALSVSVSPQLPATVSLKLPKAINSVVEGESSQAVVTLLAADGSSIPILGQAIVFSTDDPTIASVTSNGIVTGLRPGSTSIRATVGGVVQGIMRVDVIPIPAVEVRFRNRAQFLRIASNGTAVPSPRVADAVDSLGRNIGGRLITYRSTDPSVFTVSATGTVVGLKLGSASLIASADNGKVADTLSLTVTPVPIVIATVNPSQVTLDQDQTQQFAVTLTDSLATTVTGRTVTWFSSSPQVLQIDPASGLATGKGAGSATVTVQVAAVPGFPGFAQVQPASALVLPKPVATIAVNPSPISLTVGKQTQISVTLKDASGNTIFTGRTVSATVADPTVATVQSPQGTGTGVVGGLKVGKTTITFQALDQAGTPQGAPTVVNVTVDP